MNAHYQVPYMYRYVVALQVSDQPDDDAGSQNLM